MDCSMLGSILGSPYLGKLLNIKMPHLQCRRLRFQKVPKQSGRLPQSSYLLFCFYMAFRQGIRI